MKLRHGRHTQTHADPPSHKAMARQAKAYLSQSSPFDQLPPSLKLRRDKQGKQTRLRPFDFASAFAKAAARQAGQARLRRATDHRDFFTAETPTRRRIKLWRAKVRRDLIEFISHLPQSSLEAQREVKTAAA